MSYSKKYIKVVILTTLALLCLLFDKKTISLDDPYTAFQTILLKAPATNSIMREGLAAWWDLLPETKIKSTLASLYKDKYGVLPKDVPLSLTSIRECLTRQESDTQTIAALKKRQKELVTDHQLQQKNSVDACSQQKKQLTDQLTGCTEKLKATNRENQALLKQNQEIRSLTNEKLFNIYEANAFFIEKEKELKAAIEIMEKAHDGVDGKNIQQHSLRLFYDAVVQAQSALDAMGQAVIKFEASIKDLILANDPSARDGIRLNVDVESTLAKKVALAKKSLESYYGVNDFSQIASKIVS